MERRTVRVLVWIALAVPLIMVAVYLSQIRSQEGRSPDVFTVPFVAGFLLLLAAMLGLSLSTRAASVFRATLRGGSAGGLIVLGVLGAFSIGAPILLAGLLAAAAYGLSIERRSWVASLLAGSLPAIAVGFGLVVGIDAMSRVIVCPSQGEMMVKGTSLLTGQPYMYHCIDGRLEWGTGG